MDLEPVKVLKNPVTLEVIKDDKALQEMKLVKQGRLSVTPVTGAEFSRLMELAGTKV